LREVTTKVYFSPKKVFFDKLLFPLYIYFVKLNFLKETEIASVQSITIYFDGNQCGIMAFHIIKHEFKTFCIISLSYHSTDI